MCASVDALSGQWITGIVAVLQQMTSVVVCVPGGARPLDWNSIGPTP